MKCYVDVTTDDNTWREFIVATDIGETVVKLKHCMAKNEPIVFINCNKILNIQVKRIGTK